MQSKMQTRDTSLKEKLLQKGFKHIQHDLLYVGSYLVNFENKTFSDIAITCYPIIDTDELKRILIKYKDN